MRRSGSGCARRSSCRASPRPPSSTASAATAPNWWSAASVYADALAASEAYVAETGALPVHAYDQPETLLGQGTVGLEIESRPARDRHAAGRGRRRRADRRHRRLVRGRVRIVGGRAGSRADLARRARSRAAGRCAGRRHRRRLRWRRAGSAQLMFPIAQRYVERGRAGPRRRRSAHGAAPLWDGAAGRRRARRRGGAGGAAVGPLPAGAGRAGRGAAVRRQHDRGRFRIFPLSP